MFVLCALCVIWSCASSLFSFASRKLNARALDKRLESRSQQTSKPNHSKYRMLLEAPRIKLSQHIRKTSKSISRKACSSLSNDCFNKQFQIEAAGFTTLYTSGDHGLTLKKN
jgi:hypothetical protein